MKINDLGVIIALVSNCFKNDTDRGGNPYILHCLRVMEDVKAHGTKAMIVALFHDVIEDGKMTKEDVKNYVTDDVYQSILLLTHDKTNVPYDEYIKNLSGNFLARLVKMADLKDNSNITRLKGLRKKDFERLEKYFRAYEYLKD